MILTEIKNQIGLITLNRPEKRNALHPDLIRDLLHTLLEWQQDSAVKIVILKANGKAFCAGADLDYIKALQHFSYEDNLLDSRKLKDLFSLMYRYPKPLVGQVEGAALAGGCGLVTLCDVVFSVPDAVFGYTEVRIGFIPALVMVFLVRKIGESAARELLLSGELVNAYQAQQKGLVHHICDAEEIAEKVWQYALNLKEQNSAQAMALTRSMLAEISRMNLPEALDYAAAQNAAARASDDCKKGIAAFLNKQKPEWT